MAYAPLVGQDGGSCAFDLPDEGSGIFLRRGLDDPNHVDRHQEFSIFVRRVQNRLHPFVRLRRRRDSVGIRFCSVNGRRLVQLARL